MLAKGGLQWAKARDPALIGVLPSLAGAEGREAMIYTVIEAVEDKAYRSSLTGVGFNICTQP